MADICESNSVSTVEMSEKGKVSQEASRGVAQPVALADECIAITERWSSHREWLLPVLRHGDEEIANQSQTKPRIQMVPKILRRIEKNKECYDPMVVSIGPYHHDKLELEDMEKLKPTIAHQLLTRNGRDINDIYEFDEVARKARECYADENLKTKFDDEEFARIMFLDGCFVLHIINCDVNVKPDEDIEKKWMMQSDQIPFVLRDMFLLENQLPLQLLQTLMSSIFPGNNNGRDLVCKFIKQTETYSSSSRKKYGQELNSSFLQEIYNEAPHLLHLLRTQLIGRATEHKKDESSQEILDWHSFRPVNDLKAAGIKCTGSSLGLNNVEFKSHFIYGNLLLPPIVVDDSSKPKFLNLIAYEACPDFRNDYTVTSYICFLDALIDRADDVKELRTQGILLNLLGSDEHVADLFNELSIDLVPNRNIYGKVKGSIEGYYKKKWNVFMTDMLHQHFSTPWTAVAFFAAVLIICLTIVQTYFAVFPIEKEESRSSERAPRGRFRY